VDPDPGLLREAETITDLLRAVRLILKRPLEVAIAGAGLTAPQVSLLTVLARSDRLSLKDLVARLGLAHSTVSGIVDRLERRSLVRREVDASDKRLTRVCLTKVVKSYIKTGGPLHHPALLVEALHRASPKERARVVGGLKTLRRLLEAASRGAE
jgi:DNA-binding MarR family transcriptional regulator